MTLAFSASRRHEERLAGGNAQPPPLTDRVADDACVPPEHPAVDMHDLPRPDRLGLQLLDQVRISTLRHEADVLAVALVGDSEPEIAGNRPRRLLREVAQRKTQEVQLLPGRGEEEIALVALKIDRAEERAPTVDGAGAHVVTGGHRSRIQLARGREQIGELHGLIAGNAGYRRFTLGIAPCERLDDGFPEARLIVEHVVRDAEAGRHLAGVVNVLSGAAGAAPVRRHAVVVKLQRDAYDIVTGMLHQRRGDRRIDAARHGDDHARRGARSLEAKVDINHERCSGSATIGNADGKSTALPNLKGFQYAGLGES